MEKFAIAFLVLLALVLLAGVIKLLDGLSPDKTTHGSFGPKQLVTPHEQGMYWRLVNAFPAPEYIVLTQVSFGALLTAHDGASRYSFSQKRADFVLTNKHFKVLAMIELDDSSHKGRERQDSHRDAMLIEAGYKVLRYPRIPEIKQLLVDLKA